VTVGIAALAAAVLVVSGLALLVVRVQKHSAPERVRNFRRWWIASAIIYVAVVGAILLGAAYTMAMVLILSILCYRDYARSTGLFRERVVSACVVAGVVFVTFAAFDHYDRLFFAAGPVSVAFIAAISIPLDRPKGFVQRVALGTLGFLLFGFSMGYMSNIANDANYRPILLLILLGAELDTLFAFTAGRLIGGPKLLPNTAPTKTISGAIAALILTTAVIAALGSIVFEGTPMHHLDRLIALGVIISGVGLISDLMLSSIKRDVGIKETGALLRGQGGLLDRLDALVLVPPAVYHYLSLYLGPLGEAEPARILTGG
jgi:phosphatidate cytidylyltransferase